MIRYQQLLSNLPKDWQPTTSPDVLASRATLMQDTRRFFDARDYLEVDTPCLLTAVAPEHHIEPFKLDYFNKACYLQTSPELAMKRLLASGSGPIYQLAHVFRYEDKGRLHSPEFRMLEWYNTELDYTGLMQEVDQYIRTVLCGAVEMKDTLHLSYQQVFMQYVNLDPFNTSIEELKNKAVQNNPEYGELKLNTLDDWLDLIISFIIQPDLPKNTPVFIHDYPATQASLSELKPGEPAIAQRFELLIDGIELANGFQELTDADEQLRRFISVNESRKATQLDELEIDLDFIAALKHGMPACAGVAVGLDRLLMIKLGVEQIDKVIPFAWK